MTVDFPAPFGPITEVILPGSNVRLSSSTAWSAPKRFVTDFEPKRHRQPSLRMSQPGL